MEKTKQEIQSKGYKLVYTEGGIDLARAYVYIIKNDLHEEPYAFLEDVYVNENNRGSGYGTQIVEEAIELARSLKCSKIIGTSRHERHLVHTFYQRLGFKNYGIEFRMDLY
jgi:GNAT superfamily N-acetyltransferase